MREGVWDWDRGGRGDLFSRLSFEICLRYGLDGRKRM